MFSRVVTRKGIVWTRYSYPIREDVEPEIIQDLAEWLKELKIQHTVNYDSVRPYKRKPIVITLYDENSSILFRLSWSHILK